MAIDVRITDVPFSEAPDHEAKVFINDGGKLRQTDLTTIAKYSNLYELIIGAHDTAMSEITQQLESGQLGMAEAFDSYMSQLNATHAHLDLALEELKGEIEDDMTQRAETMTAEYTAMRNEYTGLFSESTEALEETRKNIDAQIQTGTNDIAQQSQDVLAQLTGLFNNSVASLQNTKSELEAALNAKHLDIVDDLDKELAQHIETCNGIHASYKTEMEQIITNGQADIQRIIDNVGDLSEAVATLDDLKDDVEALRKEMEANAGLQEHLTASNPHGITKSTVGLSNVVNERQYSASNPQPSVQRVVFSAGSSDVERPILVGSENTSGQNVYSAPGITVNYKKKTLTAPGGFKGNADSATTLVGLTTTVDELNQLAGVSEDLQSQITDLGKSVADGKQLLADTISEYGYFNFAGVPIENITFDLLNSGVTNTVDKTKKDCYSPNGRAWTKTKVSGDSKGALASIVKYLHGLFLAGGYGGIYCSTDGINWTKAVGDSTLGGITDFGYGDGIWVATTTGNGVFWSQDGLRWFKNANFTATYDWYYPTYCSTIKRWFFFRWTAGMSDISIACRICACSNIKTGSISTVNGGTGSPLAPTNIPYFLTCINDIIYVGCHPNAKGGLHYSTNGSAFTATNLDVGGGCCWNIKYADGVYVAFASQYADSAWSGGLMYSEDGRTWTPVSGPASTGNATNRWYGLTYGDGVWLAFCTHVNSAGMWTSTDGKTWTLINTDSLSLPCIAYGNGVFVGWGAIYYNDGTGEQGIFCSVDKGKTWKRALACNYMGYYNYLSSDLFVAYGNGTWVAPSHSGQVSGTMYYSEAFKNID